MPEATACDMLEAAAAFAEAVVAEPRAKAIAIAGRLFSAL